MAHYIFKSITLLSPTKSRATFVRDGEVVELQISGEWIKEDLCIVSCFDRVYNQDLLDDKDLMRIDQALGSFFWLNNQLEKIDLGTHIRRVEYLNTGSSSEFVLSFGSRSEPVTCVIEPSGELQVRDGQTLPSALANEELKSSLTDILKRIAG